MNDLISRKLVSENNADGLVQGPRCEVPLSVAPSVSVTASASLLRRAACVQELLKRQRGREDDVQEDEN